MLAGVSLSQAYGKNALFSEFSFALQPGECLCVTGPAGSGKSSLLRLLIGVEQPSHGSIEVDGVDLRTLPAEVLRLYRTRLGVIFQEPQLLWRMTAAENVAYPLEVNDMLQSSGDAVPDILKRAGLSEKALLLPDALSASERMMICVARALVTNPMIILADEPFAPLDASQRASTLSLLLEARKRGASLLVFTQDPSLAEPLGGRVLSLQGGAPAIKSAPRMESPAPKPEQPQMAMPAAAQKSEPDRRKIKITSISS